jgi:hypothetical protein
MGVLAPLGAGLVVATLAAAVAYGRRAREAREAAAATVALHVDGDGIARDLADGRHEEVRWDELREVRIVTLPRGPWSDRVRIVLDGGDDRGCIVPRDAAGADRLVAELGRLPGLDIAALGAALDGTSTGQRVVWSRAPQL